jgi:hypothetical protein
MNNKQQTAVEWYIKKLLNLDFEYAKGLITLAVWSERKKSLIEQAKEMEKEQMIKFSEQVFRNRYNEVYQSLTKVATDTYNETYGGGEQ